MELEHLHVVRPPRHGVLRVVASADADVAAVLDDVMKATILAISLDLRTTLSNFNIYALCSAAARADMPTLTVPAASSEGVPAGCVAVADLPNPLDAVGGVAGLYLAKIQPGHSWRLFFIPMPDNGEPERVATLDTMPLHFYGMLVTTVPYVYPRIFTPAAVEGSQEFAIVIRKFDRALRQTAGLPIQTKVDVYDYHTNERLPCRQDDAVDAFGTSWIVLNKPCPANTTLRFQTELPQSTDDYVITITFWKRLPKWARDDRHAWTRCCVDTVL